VELRFAREGKSDEYRLQFAGKAAKQVCARVGKQSHCPKFHRAVDTALLIGLLKSYKTFCDDVFGETSPLRPLFGFGSAASENNVDTTGAEAGQQKCTARTEATRTGSELSTPHTMEFASFALCMALPPDWRLPLVKPAPAKPPTAKPVRRSLLEKMPRTGKELWHEGSKPLDVWPWELKSPGLWQKGQSFWRKRRARNPFEVAFAYASDRGPTAKAESKPAEPLTTAAPAKEVQALANASVETAPVATAPAATPAATVWDGNATKVVADPAFESGRPRREP
jgi:hypothetical protein